METKANYVAVGAFVLACFIGLVVTIMWLAGAQYSQEYAYYQASFKGPVTGLGKGTVTRYNGIDVGRVTDLVFNPNDPQSVIVTLQVQPNLNIREDSIASIDSQGFTGASFVEISGGTAGAALLVAKEGQRYPVIRTKQSTFAQLEQSAPEVVAKLNVAASRPASAPGRCWGSTITAASSTAAFDSFSAVSHKSVRQTPIRGATSDTRGCCDGCMRSTAVKSAISSIERASQPIVSIESAAGHTPALLNVL